jgi:hypothetical protein
VLHYVVTAVKASSQATPSTCCKVVAAGAQVAKRLRMLLSGEQKAGGCSLCLLVLLDGLQAHVLANGRGQTQRSLGAAAAAAAAAVNRVAETDMSSKVLFHSQCITSHEMLSHSQSMMVSGSKLSKSNRPPNTYTITHKQENGKILQHYTVIMGFGTCCITSMY